MHRLSWQVGVLAAFVEHQTVEKMSQHFIAAVHLGFVFLRQQPGLQVGQDYLVVGFAKHLEHLGVIDFEAVAQATQDIVIDHAGLLMKESECSSAAILAC